MFWYWIHWLVYASAEDDHGYGADLLIETAKRIFKGFEGKL